MYIDNSPKAILQKAYSSYTDFAFSNSTIKNLIYTQHKTLPIPFFVFDYLFRLKVIRLLFSFYIHHVFMSSYDRRKDNTSYWLSQESLYWYIYSRDTSGITLLQEVISVPEIQELLQNNSLVVAELGFGIGRNYEYLRKITNFKQYIAVEQNPFACNLSRKKFKEPNFSIINQSIQKFMETDIRFDVLFVFGGVLMYLDETAIDAFFEKLPRKGVEKIVILTEGTTKDDIYLGDGAALYNFQKRLERVGYQEKTFLTKEGTHSLDYFIMY